MKKQQKKLTDVRKALSGKQLNPRQGHAVCGGDGLETFPWIDQPGG